MVDIFVGLVAFVIVFELLRSGLSVSNGEVFFCEEFDVELVAFVFVFELLRPVLSVSDGEVFFCEEFGDDVGGISFGTGSFVADLEEFPRDLTVECLDDVAIGVIPLPLIR